MEIEADNGQEVESLINSIYLENIEILNIAYENIDEEEEEF